MYVEGPFGDYALLPARKSRHDEAVELLDLLITHTVLEHRDFYTAWKTTILWGNNQFQEARSTFHDFLYHLRKFNLKRYREIMDDLEIYELPTDIFDELNTWSKQ